MGLRRYAACSIAALMLAVTLPGCHSKSHGGAAGTKLRDGLVVAPNTRLAGAVFDARDGRSWQALLDVDRDPVGVYDAYVAQARKLHVPIAGSATSWTPCPAPATTSAQGQCEPIPTCSNIRALFQCSGFAVRTSGSPFSIAVTVNWGRNTRQLLLVVSRDLTNARDKITVMDSPLPTGPLPRAKVLTPATSVGQHFGMENDAFARGYTRFSLVEGSRVVSDAPELGLVVLEITGDPIGVLTRYAQQLAQDRQLPEDGPAHPKTAHLGDGRTIITLDYSPYGGGGAEFTTDESHHFIQLTYSSD